MWLENASNISIKNLKIDFDPLPFAEGIIIDKNKQERYVDVRILDGFDMPPTGGPTHQNGEQAWFAMIWPQDPGRLSSKHYFVTNIIRPSDGQTNGRIVRLFSDFQDFDSIRTGRDLITVPVRGIAHCALDGANIQIDSCKDIQFEDIQMWSAPWFAVRLNHNKGHLSFRRFNICPKPDTQRHTSVWRDGFHVKANRASLLWEECRLEGMNDDALNIATHMSEIVEVVNPEQVKVRQNYPLDIVDFLPNDQIVIYDVTGGKLAGQALIVEAKGKPKTEYINNRPTAPIILLQLNTPIKGLKAGDQLWNATSANPDTMIRRCKIFQSCRFQSPVTIDDSLLNSFCWFYGTNIEGPLPSNVTITNSTFVLGRGNRNLNASFSAQMFDNNQQIIWPSEPVIHHVKIEECQFDGNLQFEFVDDLILSQCQITGSQSQLIFNKCHNIVLNDNCLRKKSR